MKGAVENYKRSRHSQKNKQTIAVIDGVKNRNEAEALKGKTVTYTTSGKRQIKGKIVSAHGGKGAVRIVFSKGLPGQALGQKIEVD